MREKENLKSLYISLVMIIIFFPFAGIAEAQSWEQFIERADEALNRGNHSEATKYYYGARDVALKENNWNGLIRAGIGFIVVGNPQEAINSWYIAQDIVRKQQNLDGLFRVGRAFAALGEKGADETFQILLEIAQKQENWEKLVRVGHYFAMIGDRSMTEEVFRNVLDIARKQENWEGVYRAAQGFASFDNQNEAKRLYHEMQKIAEKQGQMALDNQMKRVRFFTDTLLILGLRPGLADGWKVSGDGRTLTMYLRRDIRCFNGEQFNVKSVVASIPTAESVDDYTVRLHLGVPNPILPLLNIIDDLDTSIQCP